MANDREVLREVWDGRLPIKFSIGEEDRELLLTEKDPYYILVPRMTYLPLLPVKKHFESAIPVTDSSDNQPTELWFSYKDVPLKWQIPIGVLYDLVGGDTLPWEIKLRISEFPADKLSRLGTNIEEIVRSSFIHNVKEAGYMKHRGAVMMHLLPDQHTQLWRGLHRDKFDDFWKINHRLMEHIDNAPYRCIPFRIYSGIHDRYIQKFFKPMTKDEKLTTLGQLLKQFLPESVVESDDSDDPDVIKSYEVSHGWKVKIHGIETPLNTPIQWLSEHLSHADNFLYIVTVNSNS